MKNIFPASHLFSYITSNAQIIFDTHAGRLKLQTIEAIEEIVLNGMLNESTWKMCPIASNFVQDRPDQGKKATQETEVRVAFDQVNLYGSAVC